MKTGSIVVIIVSEELGKLVIFVVVTDPLVDVELLDAVDD